ncbi:MAG: oxidoreductase [Bacteroidetes bacterium GWC2_33_15]|nr:MAG: oxidoreductase [Bacteroidetes bacterium GWA2_33_15]OFX52202.1 MAG: oxidoreductase [Bacteroidetes bacterium GWC2_33_15]OFX64356.1 MAG: oxidoreductase [Bacteroidetes bacterium GWB2_32_14]OFX67761.1 MAG: oxidoreductase [Bacteroidetes bacterium GWD2_33_33]HAN19373.1 oxidoreductase [Bacteroidales bacterium]
MNTYKNFGLIGVAGYIAERHLKAIKDTGNRLVASLDKFDCVGKIDSYFPDSDFFTEYERFDRHIDKLKRLGTKIDFVSICTPNYLHDSHIRFALRHGADAICEKPVVLNPWNIDALQEIERETGRKVNNILQLRLHPSIIELKKKIDEGPKDKIYDVDLSYITSRGKWYFISWKGDIHKSGGVATNIGVHFFDMLTWIFGDVMENIVNISTPSKAAGYLKLKNANVRWFLSVDFNDIPKEIKDKGQRTFRSITVEGNEIEFSGGFTDLHSLSYQQILKGNGFGLEETKKSIQTVYTIRNSNPIGIKGNYHPFCKNKV